MCGVAGIYHKNKENIVNQQTLKNMVRLLHHRGPDEEGYWIKDNVGLGHARLSIIDLSSGQQPIHNEDKTIWVVFNGEIFNYVELRHELIAQGHSFYTKSDTEVIVHLYEQYGRDFVRYLNGQFAICLWDDRKKELILVRDRVGIVPLYYTEQNKDVIFGSEIKAIIAALDTSPVLNPNSLDQLMTFWSPISPNTLFKDIYEVSPGNMIIFSGKKEVIQYWDWSFSNKDSYLQGTDEELAGTLHDLLIDATKIRLRSDVPVGAYLSGGLDSSVLVSLIHHYSENSLRTFSISFEDKGLDESDYQKEMIEHLSTQHSQIFCKNSDVGAGFLDTIWHTESTILRTAPVPMNILSGLVQKQNYKVVLTGEGSDEVLGGYDIFKETKIRQFWARNKNSQIRPILLKRLYPYLDISKKQGLVYLQNFFGAGLDAPEQNIFSHLPRWQTTAKCKDFFSNDLKSHLSDNAVDLINNTFPEQFSEWESFNKAQYIESKSLMSGYLLCSQGDRMLMKNSVEGRFPFLDHRVIEFANKLDPRVKMKVLNEKYLLKKAMQQYLPKNIVKRYKQPYRAPDIAAFYSGNTPEYVEDMISNAKIADYGYFDPKRVERLIAKIKKGRAIAYKDNMAFVGILSTQLWHLHFIENFNKNFSFNTQLSASIN